MTSLFKSKYSHEYPVNDFLLLDEVVNVNFVFTRSNLQKKTGYKILHVYTYIISDLLEPVKSCFCITTGRLWERVLKMNVLSAVLTKT